MRFSLAGLMALLAALPLLAAARPPAADDAADRVRRLSDFAKGMDDHHASLQAVWFQNADFLAVFQKPVPHLKEIAALLADSNRLEIEKEVAVASMRHLPPLDYLKFINRLAELRAAGKVSEHVFLRGALPSHDETTFLADNYRDVRVKAFLKKARGLISDKSHISTLDEIESGAAAREVKKLRQGEQLKDPPRKLPAK